MQVGTVVDCVKQVNYVLLETRLSTFTQNYLGEKHMQLIYICVQLAKGKKLDSRTPQYSR